MPKKDEMPQIADTPEFWRWLACEFKKLLRPSRLAVVYAADRECQVTDGKPSERAEFCHLGAKGAIAAGVVGVDGWLNLLRDEGSNSYFHGSKEHGGWIEKPVRASVDYCLWREVCALERDAKPSPNGATEPKPNKSTSAARFRRKNDELDNTRRIVRQMLNEGASHRAICERLGAHPRPPHAAWRDEPSWSLAYRKYSSSVTKWISDCRK